MPALLSPAEWSIVALTLRVALYAVAGALPVAILIAALLSMRFPLRFLLNATVHLPLALPPVVTGWLLLVLFGAQGPIGGWLAARLHIHLPFTTAGAALACAVMVLPLMVRAIRLALDGVEPGLLAAARTLGAGRLDRFFSVTLPLALPGVLLAAVLGFTASLGEFGAVITFAANIPGETQTLPLAIYTALETVDGGTQAARLSLCSVGLALAGLVLAEALGARLARSR